MNKQSLWLRRLIIIIFALCVISGVLYKTVFEDEALNAGLEVWLADSESSLSSENAAFYFLNGMLAARDDEMRPLTEHKLMQSAAAIESFFHGGDEDYIDSELSSHGITLLELPDEAEICALKNFECYQRLLQIKDERIRELLDEHQVFLDRHNQFFRFESYVSLFTPHIYGDASDFTALIAGQRLYFLKILLDSRSSSCSTSIESSQQYLAKLRQHLADSETLLAKMIFVNMLGEYLETISIVLLKGCEPFKNSDYYFAPLSELEVSMLRPYRTEFVNTFNSIYTIHERDQRIFYSEKVIKEFFAKAFYKPNYTANVFYRYFRQLTEYEPGVDYAEGDCLDIRAEIRRDLSWSNLVGNILFDIAAPQYCKYSLRVRLLDTKLALVNYLFSGESERLNNPHYPELSPSYDAESKQLCMLMPNFKDRRELQCVYADDRFLGLPGIVAEKKGQIITMSDG